MTQPTQQNQKALQTIQFDKLSLYAPAPGDTGRYARLTWAMRNKFPRIIVYTNHTEFGTNLRDGIIYAPMDIVTFNAFLNIFSSIIDAEPGTKHKLDCYTSKWENNQRTNEKVLLSSVLVGKDKDGIVWLSVIEEGKPKIKFDIVISDYHRFYNTDGTEMTKGDASRIAAKAYIHIVSNLFSDIITDDIKDTAKVTGNQPKPQPATPTTNGELPPTSPSGGVVEDDEFEI